MKAAVLFETGRLLRIIDGVNVPELQQGQVLVDVAYSGVCHSQLMEVRGLRGPDRFLPHLLGHEATGVVRATGDGVTKVATGDKVILGWIRGEGAEAPGAKYDWNGQVLNSGGVTTFSEQTVVSENRLVKLPQGLAMDVGVLFGCAIPTGAGMALNEIDIREDSTVAVVGLGGIGAIAAMYAKAKKPRLLIGIDIVQEKLETARSLGCDVALDSSSPEFAEKFAQVAEGGGVDFCIDAAGKTATIELAFELVRRKGGLCVFASHPAAGQRIKLDPFELINGKQIKGSWGGATVPDADIPRFFELYSKSDLPLNTMITKRYSLDDINQALDDLEEGIVVRPLIEINPSLE